MSRIFNISFEHKGHSYTALVSVNGNEKENSRIYITTYDDQIRIMLPNGNLVINISELLQSIFRSRQKDPNDNIMHVTKSISVQLLTE